MYYVKNDKGQVSNTGFNTYDDATIWADRSGLKNYKIIQKGEK